MFSAEGMIQIQFEQAIAQAAELEEIARNLKTISTAKLPTSADNIGRNWTGDNSRQYLTKLVKMEEKITATSNDLVKTATAIRKIAKEIYDAEMRALAIARERAAAAQSAKVPAK